MSSECPVSAPGRVGLSQREYPVPDRNETFGLSKGICVLLTSGCALVKQNLESSGLLPMSNKCQRAHEYGMAPCP